MTKQSPISPPKTKFDNMVFNLSSTSTNCKPKFTPLIKNLEERYKITASTSEIYMFELFTFMLQM